MSSALTDRSRILRNIRDLVLKRHINVAGVELEAWAARLNERTPVLAAAETDEFEAEVRRILTELGTSHTAFYCDLPQRFPPQHTINATLSRAAGTDGRWMFIDVFEDGPAHVAGIRPGDLLIAVDGREYGDSEPPQFGIGAGHRLTLKAAGTNGTRDIDVTVPVRKATKHRPPMVEPKALTCRMIEGNIGLLRVVYFPGAAGMRFAEELDRAIQELRSAGCERLLLDLRGNIGGSLGFARLASYLCPDVVPIGHSLTPQRLRTGYNPDALPKVIMPRSRWELLATLARFSFSDKSVMLMTQGLGAQRFHGKVVVLVNEWTNSAGEMVAAFACEQAGAHIVGERTRGNVLGAANFNVGGGYWLRLPVFGWFTSRGCTLEGAGVAPDTRVSASGLPDVIDDQFSEALRAVKQL
jgi:carboxyl-terminal processing protease